MLDSSGALVRPKGLKCHVHPIRVSKSCRASDQLRLSSTIPLHHRYLMFLGIKQPFPLPTNNAHILDFLPHLNISTSPCNHRCFFFFFFCYRPNSRQYQTTDLSPLYLLLWTGLHLPNSSPPSPPSLPHPSGLRTPDNPLDPGTILCFLRNTLKYIA